MRSVIFSAMARLFFWLMFIASILILLRGHNEPGGGFVGGLVAAMAIGAVALADGVTKARRLLPLHPITVIGWGVLFAIVGGVPGLLIDGSFLAHQWLSIGEHIKLGTTMIFDLGVYCVVLGGMLALVFRLYEEVR